MSEVDTQWSGQVDADLVKKSAEANLIESGKYRAIVDKWEEQKAADQKEYFDKEEKNRNPFFGKPYGTLTLRLSSKREGKGATAGFVKLESPKVLFLRVSPATVMNAWDQTKLSKESKHFGWLAGLAKADGVTDNAKVIDWAKEHAFEVSISLYPEGEINGRHIDAGNTVKGIKALKEGE